jgi:hypothetical protein
MNAGLDPPYGQNVPCQEIVIMDRFVSSQLILKKPKPELLASLGKKLGLESIVEIR